MLILRASLAGGPRWGGEVGGVSSRRFIEVLWTVKSSSHGNPLIRQLAPLPVETLSKAAETILDGLQASVFHVLAKHNAREREVLIRATCDSIFHVQANTMPTSAFVIRGKL